jgi:hypothetical protein
MLADRSRKRRAVEESMVSRSVSDRLVVGRDVLGWVGFLALVLMARYDWRVAWR